MEHAGTLTAPYPCVVYTFPVAMRYDNNFREIEQNFDKAYLLPNIALKQRNGAPDEAGWQAARAILLRRADPGLFARNVLDALVKWSGGHVKTLIQLGQQAVLNAIVEDAGAVRFTHLEEARRTLRDDYMVILKREQISLLRQLHDDPNKDLDDTTPGVLELLFNGSLLEYANTNGPWADVAPIVTELLQRHAEEDEYR